MQSETDTVRPGRRGVHKVGLTASALGMLSFLLPFATISRSRIATGVPAHAWAVLDPLILALVLAPWVCIAALSVRRLSRRAAIARGTLAAIEIGLVFWASGAAAGPLTAAVGMFARYSLGSGSWLNIFAAFVLIVGARREIGESAPAGWFVSLLGPFLLGGLILTGRLSDLGMAAEYRNVESKFGLALGQHVAYTLAAMTIATILGVILGVVAFRNRRFEKPIFTVVSIFQTIPGLAMIGILVAPLAVISQAFPALRKIGFGGLGWAPLVVALTLYALLAVVRNTYAGLASVPDATVEAGRGMGMSERQVMRRVQIPLARPVLFSGVRTASQQTVGNASLGAFVAAGGLGPFIFLGVAQQANDLVLLGSVALVALALVIDMVMRAVQRAVTPRNLRRS